MFTIIIPTHDRPLLLRRALNSLVAQTHKDFHVIVVDDSAAYIPPFQELLALTGRYTYIIRSGNLGPAESRNMALEMVKTRYVLFLDDDDTFDPGHLQSLAEHIGDDAPELLHYDFKVHLEDRVENPPAPLSVKKFSTAHATYNTVHVDNGIPNCCVVFRRDVVAHARFPTELHLFEDWDFLLTCIHGRTLRHVPISSVNIHKSRNDAPENARRSTARWELTLETLLYIYKKYPVADMATRQARQAFLAKGEQSVALDQC